MRDQEIQAISVIDRQPRTTPAAHSDEAVTLGDILQRLLVHRWFIAACAIGCVALSLLYLKLRPPVYEASAVLRIDPGRAEALAISDRPAIVPTEPGETLHTEIVLLKSDDVAIRTLNSLSDDDFAKFFGLRRGPNPIPLDVQRLSDQQQGWMAKLEKAITVKQIEGTQLINLTVRSPDPNVAAAIGNAVVKAYSLETFENRAHSVAQLRTWLSSQMDELKSHVEVAQAKLTDFEEVNEVVETPGASNSILDRLRFLSERLSTAQTDTIMKEAQLRAARGGSASELATVFPNPKLSTLQAAQGTLAAQYTQLSSKFGPNYPPLVDLGKQMRQMEVDIRQEAQSVLERLNADYTGARRAQEMLQVEYDKQVELAFKLTRNQATYSVLQRDLAASRELYDALRRKLQQATVDAEVGGLNTMLVQGARVPMEPAGPKKIFILLGSLIVGLFSGAVAALVWDGVSDRVRGAQHIERELGLPVLAHVSSICKDLEIAEQHGGPGTRRAPMVLTAPSSKAADEIRALRNSVVLAGQAKTLLVTSGSPEEGALPVSVNLAVMLAHSGARVLLVDTDLHKPLAQDEFGIANGPGLGEYLAGYSPIPLPIRPVAHLENLFMVTGGHAPANSFELLSSARLRSLLMIWKKEFDYVILIGTPLLVTNVGVLLASWVDATVLLAQNGQSRVRELREIRDTLLRNRARIEGVVLSETPHQSVRQRKDSLGKETRYVYPELVKNAQGVD
jgi:polysaccharide biosynthesis transport protein